MAEQLGNIAKEFDTTVLLSVGLAPGLTNLLVNHTITGFDEVHDASIAILLGLGDRHGRAAIEWTINNLIIDYELFPNGQSEHVNPLSNGRRVAFPEIGTRTAYRFNFSDQHVLPRTLRISSVTLRLCFDSEFVGRFLGWLKRVGSLRLLRRPWIHRLAVKAFETIHFGSDVYSVRVDATGIIAGKPISGASAVMGYKEADGTAAVASAIAVRTLENQLPAGVFHVEELFDFEQLLPDTQAQIKFIPNSELKISGRW
jgi:saccharopine dehydrogenase (NAD+, L-lysine-forming)